MNWFRIRDVDLVAVETARLDVPLTQEVHELGTEHSLRADHNPHHGAFSSCRWQ